MNARLARAVALTIATYSLCACADDAGLTAPPAAPPTTSGAYAAAPEDADALAATPALPVLPKLNVKGVQAVLLHCWDDASVTTMTRAIKDVYGTRARIAVGSAPFLADTRCAPVGDRLDNLAAVVKSLRASGIAVDVIVHLGELHDANPSGDLAARFWSVWTRLVVPHADDKEVTFFVSGSLEDRYRDAGEAESAFAAMAGTLAAAHPEDRGDAAAPAARKQLLATLAGARTPRFFFHRSPDGDYGNPGQRGVTVLGDVTVGVTHERHGPAPANTVTKKSAGVKAGLCQYCFWSNDGPFVSNETKTYTEKCVDANGTENCGLTSPSPEIPMASFRKATMKGGGFRLLWRPAYNLFTTADAGANPRQRTFTKPADRKRDGSPNVRTDGPNSGFDGDEANALKAFLKK